MTESELRERWAKEQAAYAAWGKYVVAQVKAGLASAHAAIDFDTFVKIPPCPRLKDTESLVGKAFHRPEKNYADPYEEITDKVGVRFVVLLSSDIAKLQRVIEANDQWTWSLDRDFEAEREERPTEFAYQSVHYVLRAAADLEPGDIRIPQGTACEVQLRTLLQHAHSELTHDNVYKVQSGTVVTNKVHRTVAKSMALIEAVDDFFVEALRQLTEATETERKALLTLGTLYERHVGFPPGTDKTNQIVLHAYRELLSPNLAVEVANLLVEKPYIADRIKEGHPRSLVYRQPWILLAYYLVTTRPRQTLQLWPLTREEIQPVFTDLGQPME
jgi:putative GTP pyrophosphokinase